MTEIYSEPIAVVDTYVTGIARFEENSGIIRLTLYADQWSPCGNCEDKVISSRLIIPKPKFVMIRSAIDIAMTGISGVVGDTVIQ